MPRNKPRKQPVRKKYATSAATDPEDDSEQPDRKKVRWDGKRSNTDEETTTERSEDEDSGENSSETATQKTCLTASCVHGRVGLAYYDPLKRTIYVLEDTEDTHHFDLTRMVLEHADPDYIYTTSKADDRFLDMLREFTEVSGGTVIFQIRPYKEFLPARGRDRLVSIPLLTELPERNYDSSHSSDMCSDDAPRSRNAYDFMKKRKTIEGGDPTAKRWTAAIRLSNYASVDSAPLCLASIGALVDHLVRDRAAGDLENEGVRGLDIRDIEALALNDVMQINNDALFSLQIFENENHASVHSDKTKEGLSLFGILNTTKTVLGRALMKTWLLRPSLSLRVIRSRHEAVACFMVSENISATGSLHVHLKGIRNVPRTLGTLRAGRAKVSDWQNLVKFTFHCAMLKDSLTELEQASDVEIVQKLVDVLDIATLRDVGNKVNEIIDWEESAEAGRACVRSNVDEELDNRKHVYYGIDSVLSKVAEQIGQTVTPDFASALNIVYFPQLGFLICVPMREEWQGEGIKVIDGWSFQFSSEQHVYFKSQEMHDMDSHIGDLHSLIVDREIEIVQDLLEEILEHETLMNTVCDVCAELDCLLAFADASRAYNYRRPTMVDEDVIDIRQGRHPLQELVVDTFVPNDAHLGGLEEDDCEITHRIALCTGANACGKSVYLKQIALIQYMAQIGCFVPAESAILGLVDKLFTRISTRESVSRAQSAFMIDLSQVSYALRNSTSRSLILLDEFGKGTLATDGAGLLCGVLKHFLDRGRDSPKVLAATHFHDIFRDGLLNPVNVPISFLHMQVMFVSNAGSLLEAEKADNMGIAALSLDKITYLYRVADGLALDSHAAKCASVFGIPDRVVRRATYVSNLISKHEIGRLLDEEMSEQERSDLADAEAVCRRFLAWNLEDKQGVVKRRLSEVLGRREDNN